MPTYIMETMKYKFSKFIFFCMISFILPIELVLGEEAYFDLSDNEIQIQTDFNGKEIIIFGLTDPRYDTILVIKGPKKDATLTIKERLFGIWIKTKKPFFHT